MRGDKIDNDLLFELEDAEGQKKQKSVDRNYVVRVITLSIIAELCIMCFFHFLPDINAFLFPLMQSGNAKLDGTIVFNLAFCELLVCTLSATFVIAHCAYSIYKQLTGYMN